jgi:hypothetical protein
MIMVESRKPSQEERIKDLREAAEGSLADRVTKLEKAIAILQKGGILPPL